jgi:serine/threonine protein kinase
VMTAFAHRMTVGRSYAVGYSLAAIPYHSDKIDFISRVCEAACLAFNACASVPSVPLTELDDNFFFLDISCPQDMLKENFLQMDSEQIGNIQHSRVTTSTSNTESPPPSSVAVNVATCHTPSHVPSSSRSPTNSKSIRRNSGSSTSIASSLFESPHKHLHASIFFAVEDVAIINNAPDDVDFYELMHMQRRQFGRNSTVHSAVYRGEKVAVKLMMPGLEKSSIAQSEFDNEQNILRRVVHPNIVKLIGTGTVFLPNTSNKQEAPLRFTVLEWLEGSLGDILSESNTKTRTISKVLKGKKNLSLVSRLLICRDLTSALNYLHNQTSFGISIIHRAFEPDNIRLDDKGVVKLTGFGHSVCVRSRELLTDSGQIACPVKELHPLSFRYTPPEVALRLSYSEKTDVYSLGIVMWQIIRDKVPFHNMSRSDFMDRVVYGNERPKLSKVRPVDAARLLQRCWASEQATRPSCEEVVAVLETIILSGSKELNPSFLQSMLQTSGGDNRPVATSSSSEDSGPIHLSKAESAHSMFSRHKPSGKRYHHPPELRDTGGRRLTSVNMAPFWKSDTLKLEVDNISEEEADVSQDLSNMDRRSAWF